MTRKNRREFLETLCVGGAGVIAAGSAGIASGFPANDMVRVGVIGCGGRVRGSLLPKAMQIAGVRITAVCDIYRPNLESAIGMVKRSGEAPFATKRFENLLERGDVDAVIVGTPDHWHVPISVAACESGKDVYCEKPLTHDLAEGEKIIAAQNEHRRVVQVGAQQRSIPHVARAREIVREGRLGEIHKVHMSWNRNFTPFHKRAPNIDPEDFDWKRFLGNAPEQPFDPFRALGNWRWFWDFGSGLLGDLMVHWLDTVNWFLDLPLPSRAVTLGDHYATAGVWETPDTIQTIFQYPDRGLQAHFEGTFVNQFRKAGMTFMGTKATLYADRGRFEVIPEPGRGVKEESVIPGSAVKGADFDIDGTILHIGNWIDCVRSREKPVEPAEAGVLAAAGAHIGNAALPERK